jgi:hypothetical protein
MAADASEEAAEVGKGVEAEALAGGDQAGQHGGGPSPLIAASRFGRRPIPGPRRACEGA